MYKTLLLSAVLSLAVVSASAQSGNVPLFTNVVAVSATSNAVTSSAGFSLESDQRLAVIPSYSLFQTNNGTTTTTFSFNLSFDRIVWTTTLPLVITATNNATGTNTVSWALADTNITQNARYARLDRIANSATNALRINSIPYRFFH